MTPYEIIARMQDRRDVLEAARVETLARLNALIGGIAEIDYLVEQCRDLVAVTTVQSEDAQPKAVTDYIDATDAFTKWRQAGCPEPFATPPALAGNLSRALANDVPPMNG